MTTPPSEQPDIDEIFAEALHRDSGPAREAYLAAACAGRPEMRLRVERLLEASAMAGQFLEEPAPWATEGTASLETSLHVGERIGPYRILEKIGEGGMGIVYMAEQSEPVKRRVALKVIKPGMDSRQVLARFDAERQALTWMDHPHVARVLDAGHAADGRPYFAMELVRGIPITQYCDEKKLDLRQRLALFIPVCQAVQHAHQKGIIHRDIKPSNVLVAEYDERPVPKVIDFGLAKAMGQPLTDKTMFTGFGQLVGTPVYMSPEQATWNQRDVDTRTDVYSLGVLLYEILTGLTPFDKQRIRSAAWDEMLRIIREEEPPRPSTRLSSAEESLASISATRHVDPLRLARLFRGELDWIVMKAIEKPRERRYDTARHLAEDIQRYLDAEPILARPPSRWYRWQKTIKRHRTVFALLTLIAMSLIGAIVGTASGWRRAETNRLAAQAATVQAQFDARRAVDAARQAELSRQETLRALASATRERERADTHAVRLTHELGRSQWLLYAQQIQTVQAEMDRGAATAAALVLEQTDAARRHWEYSYLQRRLSENQRVIGRDLQGLTRIEISPDETFVVACGEESVVRVWRRADGALLHELRGATGPVTGLAIGTDGRSVIGADAHGKIHIWDLAQPDMPRSIDAHETAVLDIQRLAAGTSLVSATSWGEFKVWELPSGRLLTTWRLPVPLLVDDFDLTADDRTVAVVGSGDAVTRKAQFLVLDIHTGQLVREIDLQGRDASRVTCSPDGRWVATSCGRPFDFGADTSILLWNLAAGQIDRELAGSRNPVWDTLFDATGTTLYSCGSLSGSITEWTLSDAKGHRDLPGTSGPMRALTLARLDAEVLGAGTDRVHIWKTLGTPRDATLVTSQLATGGCLAPDGQTVFAALGLPTIVPHSDGQLTPVASAELVRWNTRTGERQQVHGPCMSVYSMAASANGRFAATLDIIGEVQIWDLMTWQPVSNWKVDQALSLAGVEFLNDREVAVAHGYRCAIHDYRTGTCLRSFAFTGPITKLACSSTGSHLALVSGNQVLLIESLTGQVLAQLPVEGPAVSGLALDSRGTHWALCYGNGTVRWIRTSDHATVWSKSYPTASSPLVTADDRRLFIGAADRVAVLELEYGTEVMSLPLHDDLIRSLEWGAQGAALVSAGLDNRLRIWWAQ